MKLTTRRARRLRLVAHVVLTFRACEVRRNAGAYAARVEELPGGVRMAPHTFAARVFRPANRVYARLLRGVTFAEIERLDRRIAAEWHARQERHLAAIHHLLRTRKDRHR